MEIRHLLSGECFLPNLLPSLGVYLVLDLWMVFSMELLLEGILIPSLFPRLRH